MYSKEFVEYELLVCFGVLRLGSIVQFLAVRFVYMNFVWSDFNIRGAPENVTVCEMK